MIEFDALAIKANIDELHDIIKIILGYLLIVMPESLKEWKVVIMSVGQEYKSIEEHHDYKTSTGTIYGG